MEGGPTSIPARCLDVVVYLGMTGSILKPIVKCMKVFLEGSHMSPASIPASGLGIFPRLFESQVRQ